jgi:signal transduction histidine kinase
MPGSVAAERHPPKSDQFVTAREEERRGLHRDLHDGLGPTLTGAGYKADAAVNVAPTDAATARTLMGEVRADIGTAIDEVRRLVYGLRPPGYRCRCASTRRSSWGRCRRRSRLTFITSRCSRVANSRSSSMFMSKRRR